MASAGAPASAVDAKQAGNVELTVIAVDPAVVDEAGKVVTVKVKVPADRVEPGPRSHRFHVVDYDTTSKSAAPPLPLSDSTGDDPTGWSWTDQFAGSMAGDDLVINRGFLAQNVWAIAMRTLDRFEKALGRRLPWSFTGHQLYLVPQAFEEPNAYYASEDRAILFGYIRRAGGAPPIYTGLSHNVIAHEVTHAILDGLRPRLAEPSLPDQPAFHEALADIVGLLSVVAIPEVLRRQLGQPDADGRVAAKDLTPKALRRNVLLGVATQLGSHLSGARRDALRRSVEIRPDPAILADERYLEAHSRGEIVVAAVGQALIDIWTRRLAPITAAGRIDLDRAAEEGAKAAEHLLTMCIRAVDYTPPVELELIDFLEAIVLADEIVAPDDALGYRTAVRDSFSAFGLTMRERTIRDLDRSAEPPSYHKLNLDSLRVDRDEVFRFIWQNGPTLGIELRHHLHVERVRHSTRVGPEGLIVTDVLADYIQMLNVTLGELVNLGMTVPRTLDGATPVSLLGGGVLVFDQFGKARYHQSKPIQDWTGRQQRRLDYLISHGLADTRQRYGFSYGERQGQRFSALHGSETTPGESW